MLQVVNTAQLRGAETFALSLGNALESLGTTVETVALCIGGDEARLPVAVLDRRAGFASAVLDLRRQARGARVLVAHGARTLLASYLATRGLTTPYVYRLIGDPEYWVQTRARRVRVGHLLRHAALVVVYYRSAAEALVRQYGLAPDRIRVVPKGVEAAHHPHVTADERRAAREALELPASEPVAVYIGALRDEKDPALAIAAALEVPDLHLVVVGDGPDRAPLEQQAEPAGSRVRFVGVLDDPRQAVAAADVVVLTSRTEGVPGVLLEAGLAGVPAVATAVGGVQEVVVEGRTGALVTSRQPAAVAEAIGRVLRAPPAWGDAARAHCVEHFDLTNVARTWNTLLSEIA